MSMEIKKILWPTDLSKKAAQALPYVTSLSEKYQAEIHLLYVVEELGQFGAWYGDFDRSHIDKIHETEKKMAEEHLSQICEKHLEGCPLYIRHIATGDPASEVLKLIEKEKVDVVVLASQGRKGHFGFGSVAEKVVKHSPVPVLTVPVQP
jgi:nucleotide-binding universal stress UspA family protein